MAYTIKPVKDDKINDRIKSILIGQSEGNLAGNNTEMTTVPEDFIGQYAGSDMPDVNIPIPSSPGSLWNKGENGVPVKADDYYTRPNKDTFIESLRKIVQAYRDGRNR